MEAEYEDEINGIVGIEDTVVNHGNAWSQVLRVQVDGKFVSQVVVDVATHRQINELEEFPAMTML